MPSALEQLLARHRQAIIQREAETFRALLQAYELTQLELQVEVRRLGAQMAAARERGEVINPSWLYRERRLARLLEQVEAQIERFGGAAANIVAGGQQAAVEVAAVQVGEQLAVTVSAGTGEVGTFLPRRAVETAVGFMGDGSPVAVWLTQNLTPTAVRLFKSELIKGVALGAPFNTLAKKLSEGGAMTRARALTVARTEINRARRAAMLDTYRQVEGVTGWQWVSSKSSRTCVVCLMLDGRVFKLKEEFPHHPNCRCTALAILAGVERPQRTLGGDWFAKQDDDTKRHILGRDAFAAYQKGDVKPEDFIGWRNHKEFGRSVYQKSLISVLQEK